MEPTTLHQPLYNQDTPKQPLPINLEWPERYASVAIGTKLAFSGAFKIFRHPFTSVIKLFAGGYLIQRGVSGHCDIYSRLGKSGKDPVNINIRYTFTVNRPRQEVYDFWRKLENLPLFMSHLDNVQAITATRSHWEAKIPGNVANISWEAEIVNDVPGSVIGWQSVPGSTIDNAGKVEFEDAPDGNYTIVKVVISYLPPVGGLGVGLAKLLNPVFEKIVRNDVLRFKDYMELASYDDISSIVDNAPDGTDTIVIVGPNADEPGEPDITVITMDTDENI